MSRTLLLVVALSAAALALLAAGCGGSGKSDAEKVAEAEKKLEEQLAKNPVGAGLGEASPPPPDSTSWATDFSKHLVPLDEFESGGPAKDGIPAIDEPRFTRAADVDWLEDREPVIALTVEGETRAYPIQILIWHEIVNDTVGDTPVAVTFCPLCNTAIVFDRRVGGDETTFGTTGKLRNSDLVMYDRATESWWQQFAGEALVGERAGAKLEQLPARMVAWEDFLAEHPDGLVLNRETGFSRSYGENPYVGYDSIDTPPFFAAVNGDDERLPPKERVVYVEVGDTAYGIPSPVLAKKRVLRIETDRGELVVEWRPGVASALDTSGIARGRDVGSAAVELDGKAYPFHEPFWFAVAAFRPDVEIVRG
jgi:hypothetical protein